MRFSVPYNGRLELLKILESDFEISSIDEIYFAGNPRKLPSGRRPKINDYIVRENHLAYFDSKSYDRDIEKIVCFCRMHGIEPNLLINVSRTLSEDEIEYVNFMVESGIAVITIGNIGLLKQLKEVIDLNCKMQNSVYMNLLDIEDIKNAIDRGITVFLVHPSKNHDLEYIATITDLLAKKGVGYKLMLNEGCLKGCTERNGCQAGTQSYSIEETISDILKDSESNRVLTQPCRKYMNENGIEQSNFIHPENIDAYRQFEAIYKVVGRSFTSKQIINILQAYSAGNYEGDLRDLVENFKHSAFPVENFSWSRTSFRLENME